MSDIRIVPPKYRRPAKPEYAPPVKNRHGKPVKSSFGTSLGAGSELPGMTVPGKTERPGRKG